MTLEELAERVAMLEQWKADHDDLSAELRATRGLLAVVTTQFRDDVAAMISNQTEALSVRFAALDALAEGQEAIRAELSGHRDLLVRISAHLAGEA